ncbi:MAG: MoaD/ThiS family protein [Methanoregula sp.]|nr:MoaD/ThiS family protein [Methanoregula sp.]
MKIILSYSTINIMQEDPVSITSILDKLTINPSDVIVSRNGKLVPEDTLISGDDEIRIIRIAHGG